MLRKMIILISAAILLASCSPYKLVYVYNSNGVITDEVLIKKVKDKKLSTYETLDESGTKNMVVSIDINNKERKKIEKRFK